MSLFDTKCILKDGREMRIFSNNTHNNTMNLYPEEEVLYWNPEDEIAKLYTYDEIAEVEHYSGKKMTPEEYKKVYDKTTY